MPVISVTLLPGYPADVETRLVARLATAARSVIAASPAGTTVFVNHANTYQRDGNVFSSGGPARLVASDVVKGFLEAMQQRDLDTAQSFLAGGFAMRFPGSAVMHSLAEMIAWHGRATAALPRTTNASRRSGVKTTPSCFAAARFAAPGTMGAISPAFVL